MFETAIGTLSGVPMLLQIQSPFWGVGCVLASWTVQPLAQPTTGSPVVLSTNVANTYLGLMSGMASGSVPEALVEEASTREGAGVGLELAVPLVLEPIAAVDDERQNEDDHRQEEDDGDQDRTFLAAQSA